MRFRLGWISFLLVTAIGTCAFGQVKGEVESVGFGGDGLFRGACWTPMIVRLEATTGSPFKGRIIVKQDDLDGDHVTYWRKFELGGNLEGGSVLTQRYWMYFRPQPSLRLQGPGLPLKELSQQLQVFVCDTKGNEIAQLPITQNIRCLDAPYTQIKRGTKLVLCVVGDDQPQFREYIGALGISEDVAAVSVPINNVNDVLPDSALGYESVDAIVWCDADPSKLSPKSRKALEDYIRRGGQFVILQSSKPVVWSTVSTGLGDLMPVDIKSIAKLNNLDTFKQIEEQSLSATFLSDRSERLQDILDAQSQQWDALKGPFTIAVGGARSDAMVAAWFAPGSAPVAAPFIVRRPYGLGTITWVAQDIADPDLQQHGQTDDKWIFIWNKIIGWVGNPIPGRLADDADNLRLGAGSISGSEQIHLQSPFQQGMELEGTASALMGVAVLFFIAYWVAAGPGAYLFLASKKRSKLNWFAFGLVAVVATLVTVGIVRLVLRGAPQARHVSFARTDNVGAATVRSQFGLYIPRDGPQTVALDEKLTDKDAANASDSAPESGGEKTPAAAGGDYIAAYTPPMQADLSTFTAHLDYNIDVMHPATVTIPFRSTLKKMQCAWSGTLPGLYGTAQISSVKPISGKLQNRSGVDLHDVYFAYYNPAAAADKDNILYIPSWDKNQMIDLAALQSHATGLTNGSIDSSHSYKGFLEHSVKKLDSWNYAWFGDWEKKYGNIDAKFTSGEPPRLFAILSLFNRLPVMATDPSSGRGRYDLDRRGMRYLDVSQNIAAGQLVVLAQAEEPLPAGILVDGDALKGTGVTYYQFILPLDRSEAQLKVPKIPHAPATAPAAGQSHLEDLLLNSLSRYSGGGLGWGRGFEALPRVSYDFECRLPPTPTLPRGTGRGGKLPNAIALAPAAR